MQRKNSHLLMKNDRSTFDVGSVYDVKGHNLLLYAVEFWSHHYEDVEPTENDRALLHAFLKSANFYAWIQVQSIYLSAGTQWLSGRDPRSESRRILPTWFVDTREGKEVESGYQELINEWGHLLKQGILWAANGEINRCFWGALGPSNCLSKARELEQYPSFMFMEETLPGEWRNAQYAYAVSPDGRQLMLAVLKTAR